MPARGRLGGRSEKSAGFRASPRQYAGPEMKNPNRERLGFGCWWRRRESNPRPKDLHTRVYMLSTVFSFNGCRPNGQGLASAIPS